jgi:hypothetical protein
MMGGQPVSPEDRLGQALTLLQSTPLPVDLADNPSRTEQWLATISNLQQTLLLLQEAACGGTSRATEAVRRFKRMIEGLPASVLSGMPAPAKLGLLQPLVGEIESIAGALAMPVSELNHFRTRMRHCQTALAAMAARQQAPDPPVLPGRSPT